MTSSTSVILDVGAGGQPLLRTADTIGQQTRAAMELLLVTSAGHPAPPLLQSVASRFVAVTVQSGPRPAVALNEAASRANGAYLLVLPAGVGLHDRFVERCEAVFVDDPTVAAVAPMVVLQNADGSGALHWTPGGLTLPALLADTRSVPPVFAIRTGVWQSLGGCDETLEGLILYDFWIRLACSNLKLITLQEPLVFQNVAHRSRVRTDRQQHLRLVRSALERHAAAIARDMIEVLVSREIRFGQLREAHRQLLLRRDADLHELDQVRAGTAHHRAYLAHHGRADLDWGDLRRLDPISRDWGYDRGEPVDREYIARFLARHSSDVRGDVLEVQESDLTRAYGGSRVATSSVLDIDAGNPRATILADLRAAPEIPAERFDCIILTQTLHVVDDMAAALRECHRLLKPGGVLLATIPAASRVCLEYGESDDFWRATPAGVKALFRFGFAPSQTATSGFGSILTNTAFLHGFASSELTEDEFSACDPYFPALTGVRARKTAAPLRTAARGVVLLYHRIDEQPDVHELGIAPALFAEHLDWLRSHCTVMPLDELLCGSPEMLPRRAVALTFDDGYVDNLLVASPLLEERGLPATCFLTTRWIDEPGEYWWDALERIVLGADEVPRSLAIQIGGRSETLPTGDSADRRQTHWRLHDAMVHASREERARLEAAIRAWSGHGRGRVRPMLADEIRRLAAVPGMTVGAHTVDHLALPDQIDDVRSMQIAQSRADLARLIGKPVDLFAYPYGAIDRKSAAAIRQTCRWGLSCDELPLGDSFDAARVPRLDVKRWPVTDLASRLDRLFQQPQRETPRAITLAP